MLWNKRNVSANELADRMEHVFRTDDQHSFARIARIPIRLQRRKDRRVRGVIEKRPNSQYTAPKAPTSCSTKTCQEIPKPLHSSKDGQGDNLQSANSTTLPKRKRVRKLPPLPERGEPGGLDDPLRRGLSGASVRWYLRFLTQGMTPDEARAAAVGRIKTKPPSAGSTHNITSPAQNENSHYKEMSTIKSDKVLDSTYNGHTKGFKVALLPSLYPSVSLTSKELTILEDTIIEHMYLGAEHKLMFNKISFSLGMLLLDCANKETADWLSGVVKKQNLLNGKDLTTRVGDDFPQTHIISMFLPKSTGRDSNQVLSLLNNQNQGLNTNLWTILTSKEENDGLFLKIKIDPESAQSVRKNGFSLFYRFGRIRPRLEIF